MKSWQVAILVEGPVQGMRSDLQKPASVGAAESGVLCSICSSAAMPPEFLRHCCIVAPKQWASAHLLEKLQQSLFLLDEGFALIWGKIYVIAA